MSGYNDGHASALLAEGWLDSVGAGVGARVLASVWGAEFSVLLRSGGYYCFHRDRDESSESMAENFSVIFWKVYRVETKSDSE